MTVVTIVLIAIVLGAGTLIVTNMMRGMTSNTSARCSQVGGYMQNGNCMCTAARTIDVNTTQVDCNGNAINFN